MTTLYSSTTPDDGVIRLQFNDDDCSYSLWYHGESVWNSARNLPSCDNPGLWPFTAALASPVGLYAHAGPYVDHSEPIEPSLNSKYNRLGAVAVALMMGLVIWAPVVDWVWKWMH